MKNKKDTLYKVVSKFGVVTTRDYDPTIIDRVDEYISNGFKIYVRCTECNNVHLIGTDCQVCDKHYFGYI